MNIQDLYIGKPVYLIEKSGRVIQSKITTIREDGDVYISLKDNRGYPSNFKYDSVKFSYQYNYNSSTELHILYDETKVAEYKRELVFKELDNLKQNVEYAFKAVKKHREMNYDILNTHEVNKWIDEFKRNNNW